MRCNWEPFEDKFKCKRCGTVVPRNTLKRTCPEPQPGIIRKAVNLTKAAVTHVAQGLKHCTEEQKQARYAQCTKNECGFYMGDVDGGVCTHHSCGCCIRHHGKFMDKLSWADSSCPLNYWGPIAEKEDKTPENGV